MTRSAFVLLVSLAALTGAHAQVPSGIGQQPGTLPPAPPVYVPPPPVAPAQVPSAVTPLPSPRYGIPAGVTRDPSYGSGVTPTIRYRGPAKRGKKKRRPRVSDIAPYSICTGC